MSPPIEPYPVIVPIGCESNLVQLARSETRILRHVAARIHHELCLHAAGRLVDELHVRVTTLSLILALERRCARDEPEMHFFLSPVGAECRGLLTSTGVRV